MHQAEDILMATNCVIPIYYYNDVYLQKDYVSGIYSNAYATKFFMYTTLDNGSDTLRLNLASEPDYLDPALNRSVDGACLAANSFSGLYTYNAEGKCVPACAESYEVNDEGTVYTVTLKEGLKWSDGSDLTAEDFVYSWKRAAADETGADYAYMFDNIVGFPNDLAVSAPDATTFVFELNAPCAYMEDLMAFPTFYPVKQSAVEAYADWQTSPGGWCQEAGFVSNGAFVCTGWNHDTSMTYEKNPYWYDADKVKVEKLEFMLSADDTAIYAAYNAGDVDFIDTVPTDEIASLLENPEFHIIDNLGTYYVAFNAKS
jgi:peptide/nickel transport system substrate-binding protein/oligopeptide transport system substrate-binding protein